MPEASTPQGVDSTAALQPDQDAIIPRMKLGEQGVLGLKTSNRRILEEAQAAFRFPAFIQTVNEMRNNPTVGAAMNVYRMMISRVKWDIEPPANATETDKARAAIIKTMMDDMDHSWSTFIESVIPYLEYGFAINEKVYRRRLKRNGSKFDDGLIGLKKLAPRSQETIGGWCFSPDGQELLAVEQNLRYVEHAYLFADRFDERGMLKIDREKILLFTASPTKGNPEGNSIYKNIYLAFKQLALLQNQELLGITKDVQGILKIAIPPRYLDPNASPEDQAVVAAFQQIIDNYNAGTQRGLLVPNMIDPETKQPLFTYDLMESKGLAKYDTESVIRRLQGDILSALSVDVLKLGSDGSGSFSLAEQKSSVLALAIDYRLREIAEVLNNDLMRQLYELNGWDASNTAKFVYADIEDVSLEEFSKAIQRIFSTSAIEVDRDVLNRVRQIMGIPLKPDDEPVDKDNLPATLTGQSSGAGAGMEVGTTGEGTAKNPAKNSKQNKSDNNANNSA
jgi:hypothetical protein